MMKKMMVLLLSAACLSACASTSSGYVAKVNGVEVNTEKTSDPDYMKYVVLAGIAGVFGYLGVKSLEKDGPLTEDQIAARERLRERRAACAHLLPDEDAYDECVFG